MTLRTPAIICDGNTDQALEIQSFPALPDTAETGASEVAERLYCRATAKAKTMESQLTALYQAVAGCDIVIIFNPGGYGWATISQMPLWASILNGMKETLTKRGLRVIILNYLRTSHSLAGAWSEFLALANLSRSKGQELAARTDFLTRQFPDLKIIIAGESNGAAMAEDAMGFLRENSRVYSVQTGTPFWAPSEPFCRSLIINHNGVEADTFSNGDVRRWFTANVQALFGKYKNSQGNILLYIGAPGHVYNWDYPVVREQIVKFLENNVLGTCKCSSQK